MSLLVSIIIPVYNRAHLVAETLDSIFGQTDTNWECILVDDGSTDTTIEILKKYTKKDSRFKFFERPTNRCKGGNAARNFGFEQANGSLIQWFDSDDVMLPTFLESKISLFKQDVDFVICTGYEVNQDLEDRSKFELDNKLPGTIFSQYVQWKLKVLTPSILFRKSFLTGKKLFSETILRGQETEFFSRLFYGVGANQFKIINEPLFLYRQHPNNKSSENTVYRKDFKESQAQIILQNFTLAIASKDENLANFLYRQLIKLFFLSIENEHSKNSKHILRELGTQLHSVNRYAGIKFSSFGSFYLYIYSAYRVRRQMINIKIDL